MRCVGSRVDRILAELVTGHKFVRSITKVSSDRLKQPPRLNGGSSANLSDSAVVKVDDQYFFWLNIPDALMTICTVRDNNVPALALIKVFTERAMFGCCAQSKLSLWSAIGCCAIRAIEWAWSGI